MPTSRKMSTLRQMPLKPTALESLWSAMAHMTPVNPLRRSTALSLRLAAGRYRVEVSDFFNMSCLESNANYISPGGMSGPLNDADIRALDLVRVG